MSGTGILAKVVAPAVLAAGILLGASIRAEAGYLPESSIYRAELSFLDEKGVKTPLAKWEGRPVVMTMAYTSCTHTCPLILKKLREIEAKLGSAAAATEFVIVSFDPADTPAKLAAYRKHAGYTRPNWHFLTGKESEVRKVSMLLGIKFRRLPETGEIMHDNRILMLTPEGEIKRALNGLDADIDQSFTIR